MRIKNLLIVIALAALLPPATGQSKSRKPEFSGKIIRNVEYVKRGNQSLMMTIYVPPGELKNAPAVMVIHGGGFVGGTRKMMDPLSETIAAQGMVVFNVEYRLAPRSTFPAPVEDVRCGARWIAKHAPEYGADPSRLGITGESAGAYLSAMTLFPPSSAFSNEACPDGAAEMPVIKAAVLYYGIYDMIKSYDYHFPLMHLYYKLAMHEKPAKDPELFRKISPTTYLHRGLPPILIQVGGKDPLYPESENLYKRLKELDVPVEFIGFTGAKHGFAVYLKQKPGPINLRITAEFFQKHL